MVMYGGFITLLMLAGIVVIIALVPSMSKPLLLKNMEKSNPARSLQRSEILQVLWKNFLSCLKITL